MSGPGSSERPPTATFVLDLPALNGLNELELFAPTERSALRWVVDQKVEAAAIDAALTALREAELLGGEPERLDAALAASLEMVADPLLRIRVVRVVADGPPRSVVTDSDSVGAVSILSDGREVVLAPVQQLKDVARNIADGIAGAGKLERGPRVDMVGGQALLMAVLSPLMKSGELTAATMVATIASLGGELDPADAGGALEELREEGWLELRDKSYGLADDHAARLEAIAADEFVDVVTTRFTDAGEIRHTHRFHRAAGKVWRLTPFLAGHDHLPPEDASEEVQISVLAGLSFVPQSRDMIAKFIYGLLGVEPPKKPRASTMGVRLRK